MGNQQARGVVRQAPAPPGAGAPRRVQLPQHPGYTATGDMFVYPFGDDAFEDPYDTSSVSSDDEFDDDEDGDHKREEESEETDKDSEVRPSDTVDEEMTSAVDSSALSANSQPMDEDVIIIPSSEQPEIEVPLRPLNLEYRECNLPPNVCLESGRTPLCRVSPHRVYFVSGGSSKFIYEYDERYQRCKQLTRCPLAEFLFCVSMRPMGTDEDRALILVNPSQNTLFVHYLLSGRQEYSSLVRMDLLDTGATGGSGYDGKSMGGSRGGRRRRKSGSKKHRGQMSDSMTFAEKREHLIEQAQERARLEHAAIFGGDEQARQEEEDQDEDEEEDELIPELFGFGAQCEIGGKHRNLLVVTGGSLHLNGVSILNLWTMQWVYMNRGLLPMVFRSPPAMPRALVNGPQSLRLSFVWHRMIALHLGEISEGELHPKRDNGCDDDSGGDGYRYLDQCSNSFLLLNQSDHLCAMFLLRIVYEKDDRDSSSLAMDETVRYMGDSDLAMSDVSSTLDPSRRVIRSKRRRVYSDRIRAVRVIPVAWPFGRRLVTDYVMIPGPVKQTRDQRREGKGHSRSDYCNTLLIYGTRKQNRWPLRRVRESDLDEDSNDESSNDDEKDEKENGTDESAAAKDDRLDAINRCSRNIWLCDLSGMFDSLKQQKYRRQKMMMKEEEDGSDDNEDNTILQIPRMILRMPVNRLSKRQLCTFDCNYGRRLCLGNGGRQIHVFGGENNHSGHLVLQMSLDINHQIRSAIWEGSMSICTSTVPSHIAQLIATFLDDPCGIFYSGID